MTMRLCLLVLLLALAACSGMPPIASPPPTRAVSPVPPVATIPSTAPVPAPLTAPQSEITAPAVRPGAAPVHPSVVVESMAPTPRAASRSNKTLKPAAVVAKKRSIDQAAGHKHAVAPADTNTPIEPTAATDNSVHGHLDLIVGAGQSVNADEVAEAVVYFQPDAGAPRPQPGLFRIYTHNKQFDPTSMVVPVGSTVNFPNQDEIIHNVFSATPGSTFDLGLYGEGGSGAYTFKKPGLVLVNCNVHQAMQTTILVLDTPYFVHPAKDGSFRLEHLPSGSGKLTVWHPRAVMQSQRITLPASAPITLHLTVTKPRVIQHLNKERKQYEPDRL